MSVLVTVSVVLVVAILMEGVAWFAHRFVMHGFLWLLHADHHRPKRRGWQKNDLFSLFFASVSFALIYTGLAQRWGAVAGAGFGVALYGLGYFLFHEVMFHRRLRWLRIRPRGRYLRRIVHAHSIHHRVVAKSGQAPYSFLYAGRRYGVAEERAAG